MDVQRLHTEEPREHYRRKNAWFPISVSAQIGRLAESFGETVALGDGAGRYASELKVAGAR